MTDHYIGGKRRTCRPESRPRSALLEMLESRTLMSSTITTSYDSSFTDVWNTGYTAIFQFGSDGVYGPDGDPGMMLYTNGAEDGQEVVTWDPDYTDGIDSGDRGFYVDLSVAGTDSLTSSVTGDHNTLTTSSDNLTKISQVTILAKVQQAYMSMSFSSLQIQFYQDGQLMESDFIGNLTASTLDGSSNFAQTTVQITPENGANYDRVYIEGTMHLQAPYAFPMPGDISADIHIT